MKKRMIFLVAACVFMLGCGSSSNRTDYSGGTTYVPPTSESSDYSDGGSGSDGMSGGDEGLSGGGSDGSTTDADPGSGDGTDFGGSDGYTGGDDGYAGGGDDGGYSGPSSSRGGGGYSGGGSDGGDDSDSDSDSYHGGYSGGTPRTPGSSSVNTGGRGSGPSSFDSDSDDSDGADLSDGDEAGGSDENAQAGTASENAGDTAVLPESEYGRMFFIGDSRTVDMFDGNVEEIYDSNIGGIRVFAKDGCHCAYMQDVTGKYANEFDTVISWLGCNDNNDAALYQQVYENLISQGKTVVICTVGPTATEFLSGEFDQANYPNEKMIAFNQSMTSWAKAHGVKVIDLYSFVKDNIEISPDGIHYNPKPTSEIWGFIMKSLQE